MISLFVFILFPTVFYAQGFDWLRDGKYDPSIPTPESVLGYEIGTYLTDHLQMEDYIRRLADATDRVQIFKYAKSIERRNMYLIVISAVQNMKRLEEIRKEIESLKDPRTMLISEAKNIAKETPPIGWMNYATDGDETASFECAIQLAYQLAAGKDPLTMKILNNVITIINPALNPDSHQRYVTWAKAVTIGKQGTADPFASEHHTLWFSGSDGNHYLVDANRDAFALSQIETQASAEMLHHWNPQVWVDNHGQPQEYYFAPMTFPINLNFPSSLLRWATEVGKNCARYFNQYGWTFVNSEKYDQYYPGYWDSYPSFSGAIGMCFETDGGGSKHLVWERSDKTLVTLRDAIHHHFMANLATLETLADHREEMLWDFYNFRRIGMEEADKEQFKSYILLPGSDNVRLNNLIELLLRHKFEIYKAAAPFSSQRAQTYFDRNSKTRDFPAGSYIIPLKQPQKRLIKALLEPDPKLEDNYLEWLEKARARNKKLGSLVPKEQLGFIFNRQDVTSWCLPVTYGVNAAFTEDMIKVSREWLITKKPEIGGGITGGRAGYAYLFSYMSDGGAKLCGRLLQEGYNVALALRGFKNSGRNYAKGTLFARVERNPGTLHDRIAVLAKDYGVEVYASDTAWGESEISLGSIYIKNLKKPKIMVLTDYPTSPCFFGGVYSLLEQRFDLSFTAVRTEHFVETDLFRYNVIIFPHGSPNSYKRLLGEEGVTKLKIWIKNGGTFIGIKGGAVFTTLKGVELTDIKLITEISDENIKKPVDTIPGSTFKATANTDYYLGLGYPEEIAVQVLSNYLFSKTELGANVVTFPQNSFMMGHKWEDTEEILEDKLYLADVPMGQGHVILYADDPTFRCYWTGLDRLFLSSILFSTAMN